MKKFFLSLREHALKIIAFGKSKIKLIKNSKNDMKFQKFAIFVKKNLLINMLKIKTWKVKDHCHYTGK